MEDNLPELFRQRTSDIEEFNPEHTLDFVVKKRGDKKRPYIFRYKGAQKCDHPHLNLVARGGNEYHCPDCNYNFQIGGVFVQPEHHGIIQAAFRIMRFVRLYGVDSLQEVWRRPIGQTDGTPHKPVLPEGMSFTDVLDALEATDSEATQEELAALRDWLWVGPKERQKQLTDLQRQADKQAAIAGKNVAKRQLKEGARGSGEETVNDKVGGTTLPDMQEPEYSPVP